MSVTGFQVVSVKNLKPNFRKAGQPPRASETITPVKAASKVVAAAKHSILNSWSGAPRVGRPATVLKGGAADVVMQPI